MHCIFAFHSGSLSLDDAVESEASQVVFSLYPLALLSLHLFMWFKVYKLVQLPLPLFIYTHFSFG